LKDISYYARRHPIRVFLFVLVPLIAGGILQRLLAMVGLKLPTSLMGSRSEFEQLSRGFSAGGGGSGIQQSMNGLMTIAKMFL
jgi:hypothetical protein